MSTMPVNTRNRPEHFDLYVRKFRVICDLHGVPFGSPDDLHGFLEKLAENNHLAMDFWALMGKLSSREGGELSDDQRLAVVVDGLADGDVPEHDHELKSVVDHLAKMLAGVAVPLDMPKVPPVAAPASVASAVESEADLPPPRSPTPPTQLEEALLRLELTNLELKRKLQDIDERMSRLEPHLEELTSMVAAKGRAPVPVEAPASSKATEGPFSQAIEELAHRPELPLAAGRSASKEDDGASPHLSPDDRPQRRGRIGAFLFVAFLLVALAGIVVQRYGAPLREGLRAGYSSLLQKMHLGDAVQEEASSTDQSAPQSPEAGPVNPPSAPAHTMSKRLPAVAKPIGKAATAASAGSRASRKPMAGESRTAEAAKATAPEEASRRGEPAPIHVPPAVMEANLLISRVPAYPAAARMDHVEGPVVAQAIISKGGMVEEVLVIQGDPLLRSAAEEAIYKWRYRPYLLNGEPVDVATTVTIDFKLNR